MVFVSVLRRQEGYTAKYSLGTSEIPWAEPKGNIISSIVDSSYCPGSWGHLYYWPYTGLSIWNRIYLLVLHNIYVTPEIPYCWNLVGADEVGTFRWDHK